MLIVKKGEIKIRKFILYVTSTSHSRIRGGGGRGPYRECQISALDRAQIKAVKFAHRSGGSEWEPLAQRTNIARMCALYKAYIDERAW